MENTNELKTKNKIVFKRHDFLSGFFAEIVYIIFHFLYGFKRLNKYKIKKGENVLVLSNHQTDLDPMLLGTSFNKNLYCVATDTLFNGSLVSKFLYYSFRPIPKKKGAMDLRCMKEILEINKEKGSILIFPEGNRTIGEFQFDIESSIVKLVRKLNIPLVIYNFNGGTGVSPRFSNKKRKGKFTGGIKKILYPNEYQEMDDNALVNFIKDNLRVYDSESLEKYKSNRRAEHLERIFFVCPKCNNANTLRSNKSFINCSNCGLEVEYTEDLHFKSDDKDFNFKTINDWYQYEKKWVRDYIVPTDSIIFTDDDIKIYSQNAGEKRKLLSKGSISLTRDIMTIGSYNINVKNIYIASFISSRKFNFSNEENKGFLVIGNKRFNALKYVFMFNKLDTYMKEKKIDKYYSID